MWVVEENLGKALPDTRDLAFVQSATTEIARKKTDGSQVLGLTYQ